MTILAYFADLLYADGTREEKWLTVNERNDLIGDGRIVAATYIPAVRQYEGGWLNAPAWLLDNIVTGPAITTSERAAMSAWQLGVTTVTPLQFSAAKPTENCKPFIPCTCSTDEQRRLCLNKRDCTVIVMQ